jgi:hypothetical protein
MIPSENSKLLAVGGWKNTNSPIITELKISCTLNFLSHCVGICMCTNNTLYHLRIKQKINSTLKFKEDLRKPFILIKKKKFKEDIRENLIFHHTMILNEIKINGQKSNNNRLKKKLSHLSLLSLNSFPLK